MPKTKKKRETTIPYSRGYKPPTDKQSLAAITHPPVTDPVHLPAYLQPTSGTYRRITAPQSEDDWLAKYNEDGQSYRQFIQECPWLGKRKWKQLRQDFNPKGTDIKDRYPQGVIYLLRLGNFDQESGSTSAVNTIQPNFEALVEYVKIFYKIPVQILEGIELIKKEGEAYSLVYTPPTLEDKNEKRRRTSTRQIHHTLEYRYNERTGHTQLQITPILLALKQHIPTNALLLMALTTFDLYDEPPDLFVAGTAGANARVGVFSFCRYDPMIEFSTEFWYDIKTTQTTKKDSKSDKVFHRNNSAIILQRSCKLLVHEIAHLLGVDHCVWYECCMNGSGHLQEDFRQPSFLCPVDLHKLETLCGFEVTKRYKNMLAFFEQYGLKEETKWIRKRLEFIANN